MAKQRRSHSTRRPRSRLLRRGNMRRYWTAINYFAAVAVAMMGWLWLIVWMARHLI